MVVHRRVPLPGGRLTVLKVPGGAYPTIVRGQGAYVWDSEGHRYTDYVLGSGPMVLGHAHPAVVAAVREQLGLGSTFYALNDKIVQLAERIIELAPCAEEVQFCTSGSEATFYAMRIARAATGREKILRFEGGFHGGNDYAMVGFIGDGRATSSPSSAGIPRGAQDSVVVAPFNDLAGTVEAAERERGQIAAIIVEPIQRVLMPVPGFLEGLRELATSLAAVLIFDEIVTGFRLASGGAQQLFGVVPDLATYGKVIGGGFPLAAVAGKQNLMEYAAWAPAQREQRAYMSGTLNGNPVSAVAGLATLEELSRPGAYERLHQLGERLRSGIRAAASAAGVGAQVMGTGSFFQVVYTDVNPVTRYAELIAEDAEFGNEVGRIVFERGNLVREEKMYLSLVHTEADIDQTVDAYAAAMKEIRAPVPR
jgi:glutamate-1-semialdehyde 2,1-aminomutase